MKRTKRGMPSFQGKKKQQQKHIKKTAIFFAVQIKLHCAFKTKHSVLISRVRKENPLNRIESKKTSGSMPLNVKH